MTPTDRGFESDQPTDHFRIDAAAELERLTDLERAAWADSATQPRNRKLRQLHQDISAELRQTRREYGNRHRKYQ